MSSENDPFQAAFNQLATDVASTVAMENALTGKTAPKVARAKTRSKKDLPAPVVHVVEPRDPVEIVKTVLETCKRKREEMATDIDTSITDHELSQLARFTDKFNLTPYAKFLQYVPRLVNVVTLAEAIPVEGSGIKLPLDLRVIASKCKNAYYAPKKFSAVQLAYSEPRCRVLVFHTGRLVGTGCSGPVAARLALLRAQRQLYKDAGVHIHVRNFAVINQVGAFNLRATLNCEEFANVHSSTAHYDVKSFVGLAWRPAGESICCEIYGTGRANLPGSVVERQLQDSLSRMFPELLRFSSASRLLSMVPEYLKNAHRVETSGHTSSSNDARTGIGGGFNSASCDIWEGWGDGAELDVNGDQDYNARNAIGSDDDDDDLDLTAMGF